MYPWPNSWTTLMRMKLRYSSGRFSRSRTLSARLYRSDQFPMTKYSPVAISPTHSAKPTHENSHEIIETVALRKWSGSISGIRMNSRFIR